MHDVIIAGGGPAGLNAALILGSCRRTSLPFDHGTPRNAVALLTGVASPATARRRPTSGRAPARTPARYDIVELHAAEVAATRAMAGGFTVTLADGRCESARRLILGTGLHQDLPEIAGFARYWGTGAHSCPHLP